VVLDRHMGGRFWIGLMAAIVGIGIAAAIVFLIIGAAILTWGVVGALVVIGGVGLVYAWFYDRRQQARYD
jgi:hypothetical protein